MKKKILEIVAGPNGSGKTTFAESFFKNRKDLHIYLNPDLIASGISPTPTEATSIQAGRVLISEVRERLSKNQSFCFESTLSGRHWFNTIMQAKQNDYTIVIYFLYLKNYQLNLERIKQRVAMGGHNIPTASVKRRIPRAFTNFWNLYRPTCDEWYIFDNSNSVPKVVCNKTAYENMSPNEQLKFEKEYFLKGTI